MDINSLHFFTENGDLHKVLTLLEFDSKEDKDHSVEFPDLENNTLLHIGAANNHLQIITHLLEYGANIEATNCFGWTPLMQAARHGHSQAVKILLNYGADPLKINRLGMSALMLACASSDVDTVRAILESGVRVNEDLSMQNSEICNIMIAALYGNNVILRLLLDKGMNANISTSKSGLTPLMFAVYGGSLSTIEILLERGARPELTNEADYSATDVAVIYDKHDIAKKLKLAISSPKKKKGKSLSDIMEATKQGNIQAIQDILFNDATKVETVTLEGATPLMVAAMLGNINVARLLVQYGANINAQDFANGWTPLMQAIYHRKSEMAKFLITEGADVNVLSSKSYTAFDLANETLDTEVLQMFAAIQVQNNCLNVIESPVNPSSPTVQYMKQLWSKVALKPDVSTGKKSSDLEESYIQSPYIAAKPEPIMLDLPLPKEYIYPTVLDELIRVQKETDSLMEPPVIAPLRPGIPTGSTLKLGNNFTYEHLLRKLKKSLEKKKDLTKLSEASALMVSGKSDGKIITEPCNTALENTTCLNKHIIPKSILDSGHHNQSFASLSGSLIDEIKYSIGPNDFQKLLKKLNMEQLAHTLEEQEIDIDAFLLLTRSDFLELGIVAPNKLRKVISTINKIKEMRK